MPNAYPTGDGDLVVSIVDQAGRALPGVAVGDRHYIVGEAGMRYEIAITNAGPRRYEVVAAVDGLDVVDGRPASFGKRGYVVDAHTSIRIDGFRTSVYEVASFRFGRVEDSYAARMGSDSNVGVIGMAFFCERSAAPLVEPRPDDDEVDRRQAAEPFPGNFAPAPR
jgi:hypothetical protein